VERCKPRQRIFLVSFLEMKRSGHERAMTQSGGKAVIDEGLG
jgi:hypothetical protein